MVGPTAIKSVGTIAAGISTPAIDSALDTLTDDELLKLAVVTSHPKLVSPADSNVKRLRDRIKVAGGTRLKVKAKLASRRPFPLRFSSSQAGSEITRATIAKVRKLRARPSAAAMKEYRIRMRNAAAQQGTAGSGGGSTGTIAIKASSNQGSDSSSILPTGGLNNACTCLNTLSGLGRYRSRRKPRQNRYEYHRMIAGLGCAALDRMPQDSDISGLGALQLDAISQTSSIRPTRRRRRRGQGVRGMRGLRGLGDFGLDEIDNFGGELELSDVGDAAGEAAEFSDFGDVLGDVVDNAGDFVDDANGGISLADEAGNVLQTSDLYGGDTVDSGGSWWSDLFGAADDGGNADLSTSPIDIDAGGPDLSTSPIDFGDPDISDAVDAGGGGSFLDEYGGLIKQGANQIIKQVQSSQSSGNTSGSTKTTSAGNSSNTRAGPGITSPFVGNGQQYNAAPAGGGSSAKKLLPWLIGGGLALAAVTLM